MLQTTLGFHGQLNWESLEEKNLLLLNPICLLAILPGSRTCPVFRRGHWKGSLGKVVTNFLYPQDQEEPLKEPPGNRVESGTTVVIKMSSLRPGKPTTLTLSLMARFALGKSLSPGRWRLYRFTVPGWGAWPEWCPHCEYLGRIRNQSSVRRAGRMGLTLVCVDEERKCCHVTEEICLLGNSFSTASGRKIKPSICSE